MMTKGTYSYGWPKGCVVHYTAGRNETEEQALNTIRWGRTQGFTFMLIGPTGVVYQGAPLNKWGEHAGKSYHPLVGPMVSSSLVGIEVACPGRLTKGSTAWGFKPEVGLTREVGDKHNMRAGVYVKYTDAQEAALTELILWLKRQHPDIFDLNLVLGHDSVAPGRKSDPGGSLSMSIPEYQQHLKNLFAAETRLP